MIIFDDNVGVNSPICAFTEYYESGGDYIYKPVQLSVFPDKLYLISVEEYTVDNYNYVIIEKYYTFNGSCPPQNVDSRYIWKETLDLILLQFQVDRDGRYEYMLLLDQLSHRYLLFS